MRNVSDKSCRQDQNTHFAFSNFFPPKIVTLRDNVEKYCRVGHATDDNMAHAYCNWRYTHTLRLRTPSYFSTATMVTRTRTYVHCLFCHKMYCSNFPYSFKSSNNSSVVRHTDVYTHTCIPNTREWAVGYKLRPFWLTLDNNWACDRLDRKKKIGNSEGKFR
jgi:hypothetical protein